jgi:hypothetical protein
MSTLLIRYDPDSSGDAVGRLSFDLNTEQFSGSGFFWSDLSEVPEIIAELRVYPIEKRSIWKWGYEALEGDDTVLA